MRYNFKNLNVTVIGLARSGFSCALLLKRLGAKVNAVDSGSSEKLTENRNKLLKEGIKAQIGAKEIDFIAASDIVVISPGVSEDKDFIKLAKVKKIPVISEVELGFQNCRAPVIAVTGTNGKTTVTTLIGEILKANGKNAFVCGNIGVPFCNYAFNATENDFISLEASSFQLEKIEEFKPRISLILNLTPDHLDRYKSVEDYLEAKKRIYLNQDKNDWLILNYADSALKRLEKETKARVMFFNKPGEDFGDENLNPNQRAVMAVSSLLNLDREISLKVLRDFKGIAHRMEFVRLLSGVEFINDSKATNIDSTTWALERIRKPAIMIAGGRDKGSDFPSLRSLVKAKVKSMIVIGEAGNRIFDAFHRDIEVIKSDSLEGAINRAYLKAQSGDCVLFSPMCKSFDMFRDYEDRGDKFKLFVNSLEEKK